MGWERRGLLYIEVEVGRRRLFNKFKS